MNAGEHGSDENLDERFTKVRNPTHGSAGTCSSPTYMERRLKLFDSH